MPRSRSWNTTGPKPRSRAHRGHRGVSARGAGRTRRRRRAVVLVVDLDRAWASVYLEETLVPLVRLDQAATVITDAGDRIDGRVSFISSKAEFTPRNVQTANERAKLVYRIKVAVDNSKGILKPGMPVEVDLGLPETRLVEADGVRSCRRQASKTFGAAPPWMACRSTSVAAKCSASSVLTAPARRPRCGWYAACCRPMAARSRVRRRSIPRAAQSRREHRLRVTAVHALRRFVHRRKRRVLRAHPRRARLRGRADRACWR